jgi:hypothetical protein
MLIELAGHGDGASFGPLELERAQRDEIARRLREQYGALCERAVLAIATHRAAEAELKAVKAAIGSSLGTNNVGVAMAELERQVVAALKR